MSKFKLTFGLGFGMPPDLVLYFCLGAALQPFWGKYFIGVETGFQEI
jgi:hypothetical protein